MAKSKSHDLKILTARSGRNVYTMRANRPQKITPSTVRFSSIVREEISPSRTGKKRGNLPRLPIFINLKSNTMKNTMQRYGFYVMQHNNYTENCQHLTLFHRNHIIFIYFAPPSFPALDVTFSGLSCNSFSSFTVFCFFSDFKL